MVEGNIRFPHFEKYRPHALDGDTVLGLFQRASSLLESITHQKIRCFRAGGFCIEPFSHLRKSFETLGLCYDFSVVPGMTVVDGGVYDVDFTAAPDLPWYSYSTESITPFRQGEFTEIPMSTYRNNPFYRLSDKALLTLSGYRISGDGISLQQGSSTFLKSLSRRLKVSRTFITLDSTSHFFFKYLLRRHFKNRELLIFISHPKLFSQQARQNLEYVVKNYRSMNTEDLQVFQPDPTVD